MKASKAIQWTAVVSMGFALAGAAVAQAPKQAEAGAQPQIKTTTDGVRYVTGGIGVQEQQRMGELARDFNLKLVFTLNEGNYIADVDVTVKDAKGRTVVEEVADGPYFMAQLPPGRYTVSARYEGRTVNRTMQIGERGTRTAYLRWPSNPETDFVPGEQLAGEERGQSATGPGKPPGQR